MKKKAPLRWDKIIAWVTIMTILCCVVSIYRDFNGGAKGTSSRQDGGPDNAVRATKQELQGRTAAGDQQEQIGGVPLVCIDAGHGGTDGGAAYQGQTEKTQSLAIALLVRDYLEERGVSVVMTRTQDVTMELPERVAVCNQAKAAAMVSIHRNYYEKGTSVSGVEAWVHSGRPANSVRLSEQILSQLQNVPGFKDRGIKAGTMADAGSNYYVNAHSACASCVLELGFINNASDAQLVTKYKEKTAKAISDGIIGYLQAAGYAV